MPSRFQVFTEGTMNRQEHTSVFKFCAQICKHGMYKCSHNSSYPPIEFQRNGGQSGK